MKKYVFEIKDAVVAGSEEDARTIFAAMYGIPEGEAVLIDVKDA